MNCIQLTLGEQARLFIESQLADGLKISNALRGRGITNGTVVSFLPPNGAASAVQNLSVDEFRHGGITSPAVTRDCLADFLLEFMEKSPHRLCVFEDAGAEPSFSWVQREKPRIFTFRNELYHVVFSGLSSKEELKTTIAKSDSTWILVGIATSVPDRSEWMNKTEITSDEIDVLAQRTEHIIVGAFDGEGYLIWSR